MIEFGSIDAIAAAQVFGASAGTKATQLLIVDIAFFKILISAARSSRLFSLAATREDHVALNFSTSVAYFKPILVDANNKVMDRTSLLR